MKKQLLLLNIALLLTVCLAAQPTFLERTGNENPVGMPDYLPQSNGFHFLDVDKDGVDEMILDRYTGSSWSVLIYKNVGTGNFYDFELQPSNTNAFHTLISNLSDVNYIVYYDMGNDNDIDLILNMYDGTNWSVDYYENIGTGSNNTFVQRTGSDNPFSSLVGLDEVIDFNNDGFLDYRIYNDIYLGNLNGFSSTPFLTINNGNYNCAKIKDIDGDGDYDAVVAEFGKVRFAENIGSNSSPNLVYNAFSNFGEVYYNISRAAIGQTVDFSDLNGDGNEDLVLFSTQGIHTRMQFLTVFIKENNKYVLQRDFFNRHFGLMSHSGFQYTTSDFDNDGKIDLMTLAMNWNLDGHPNSEVLYFKNEGDVNNPKFNIQHIDNDVRATNNPFRNLNLLSVEVEDFDGDGDLDIIDLMDTYYENTGTATNPNYVISVNNPYASINNNSFGDFVDIDDDGDFDFVSQQDYFLFDHVTQTYISQTQNIITTAGSSLTFVDFDNDEDFDCFTVYRDTIRYIENIGDKQNPDFSNGFIANPFSNVTLNYGYPNLEFGDFDNDGDLDLLFMDKYDERDDLNNRVFGYHLRYFENQTVYTNTNDKISNTKTYKLHAFPNPSSDRFTIEIPALLQNKSCTMQLIDITGRLVAQRQYDNLEAQLSINDLTNQPQGIYILNIKDDLRNFQVKLVKQ